MKRSFSALFAVIIIINLCSCGLQKSVSGNNNEASDTVLSNDTYNYSPAPSELLENSTDSGNTLAFEASTEAVSNDTNTTESIVYKTDKKETTTNKSANDETTSRSKTPSKTKNPCKHENTVIRNKKDATCTDKGYLGDTYCEKCGEVIEKGRTVEATGHTSIEVYNSIEATADHDGYTGDKRCRICGEKLEKGEVVPKLTVADTDNISASHDYSADEQELLAQLNAERAKEGLPALSFNESAYRTAKIRTFELILSFSHTRPNGTSFSDLLNSEGVSYTTAGENIQCGTAGYYTTSDMTQSFMDSPGHKANIMNENFTSVAICIEYIGGVYYLTQIFIG